MCDKKICVIKAGTKIGTKLYMEDVLVSCGQCYTCRMNKIDEWAWRLLQEEKKFQQSHFLTLTYNTQHVPISPNGFMTLDRGNGRKKKGQERKESHFQLFIKKLRKKYAKEEIKYYMAAEYGGERQRPHYHVILFCHYNTPDDIQSAWEHGNIYFGDVRANSIAYTAGYVEKEKIVGKFARDDRVKEYSLMSKGMGKNYVTPEIKAWHNADINRNYLTKPGGQKIAMPRYYRKYIYDENKLEEQRNHIIKTLKDKENEERLKLGDEQYESLQEQGKEFRKQKLIDKRKKKRNVD